MYFTYSGSELKHVYCTCNLYETKTCTYKTHDSTFECVQYLTSGILVAYNVHVHVIHVMYNVHV